MNSKVQEALFEAALALPPEDRAAYLDQACGADIQLRQRVEALLQAHEQAGPFMAEPAAPPADRTVRTSAPLTEKPGDKIGHYKLLQQIGEGGCGVVYMAEQEEPIRRRVAFKVIKLGMDTKQVIARFEAERQALALMDHPNIARVLDAGATDTGRPYFVMELVRGVRVTDYCDQNNLSTEARLNLFIQVCHAIQHAHQKGIIHRDIKPSNILVTVNDGVPVPKVIDFGIAKATGGQQLTDKTLFTAFEQFIGTPAYMSPEQMEMTSLDIDTRSDIYALGVLLYELLTGHTPFNPKTLLAAGLDEMRRIIREQEPVRPSTRISSLAAAEQTTVAKRRQSEPPKLIHQVRGDLDWIVMKCLEKDRTRRYETANAMAVDLEHHLRHEPVSAAAPGTLYRAAKFVRRHKVGLGMAGALVVLLVLGVVVSTWQAVRATRAEHKAQAEANKSGQVAQFLKDMLEGVGPSVALGRDTVLLKEILDKTAKRVGQDLTNQPEVEAELRGTIGTVYQALGAFGEAEAMQREALAIARRLLASKHPGLVNPLENLALVLWSQGKLAEAETLEREALAINRSMPTNKHPDLATSLDNLGVLLNQQGRMAEAEPMHREALAMRRELFGSRHLLVAYSLNNLALVLWTQGKLAEAEPLAREALAARRELLDKNHPLLAASLLLLARVLNGEGKLAEAEALSREALALNRQLLGNLHPEVARVAGSLALVLRRERKLAEAEALQREAVGINKQVFGNYHLQVAIPLDNLARVLADQGKLPEAEICARLSLAILETNAPAGLAVSCARGLVGRILVAQNRYAEAEPLLLSGYEGMRQQESKLPAEFRSRLRDALEDLVRLYQAGSTSERTAPWRSKLSEFDNAELQRNATLRRSSQ